VDGWREENISRTMMNFKIAKDIDKTAKETNHQVTSSLKKKKKSSGDVS
jgi:hypothetical protein